MILQNFATVLIIMIQQNQIINVTQKLHMPILLVFLKFFIIKFVYKQIL